MVSPCVFHFFLSSLFSSVFAKPINVDTMAGDGIVMVICVHEPLLFFSLLSPLLLLYLYYHYCY